MSVILQSSGGGQITLQEPTTASNFTQTLPAATGSVVLTDVAGTLALTATGANIITASTNGTERMRIDSSGNVLVNTTTAYAKVNSDSAVAGGYNYSSNSIANQADHMVFKNGGTTVGSISRNAGSAVSYNTTSDYRLKDDVQPMIGALAKVSALKPVTYKWKLDGVSAQGFIAHELQAVVPDCVTGEKDAVDAEDKPIYQGIDVSFLVATLTAAIQEQQVIIAQLQADVVALKGTA
jgi:hypothetical protein